MTLFILSAGLGERLRPLTDCQPKPLVPFLGIPLIIHAYGFWRQQFKPTKLIFNGHYKSDLLHRWLRDHEPVWDGAPWIFSDESDELLGGAGALWQQRSVLDTKESFWVMNSDEVIFFKNTARFWGDQMWNLHSQSGALATLLVTNHPEAGKSLGAVWADSNGDVLGFGRSPIIGSRPWHYVGLVLLSPEIFKVFPSRFMPPLDILHDILKIAISKGFKVQICYQELLWVESGVFDRFADSQSQVEQWLRDDPLVLEQYEFRKKLYQMI